MVVLCMLHGPGRPGPPRILVAGQRDRTHPDQDGGGRRTMLALPRRRLDEKAGRHGWRPGCL